ncbi:MAG: DNA mismatch repair protein MutT [Chloroflexi bacterium HGW-Chloroflexi-10]|nr:MAG: DNA mismatch repair protein MutT [Chloroflexi bacterium HGW-Chloroflexi-10]
MKRVDVVYALIFDETKEKILMVNNVEQSNWTLPGGAVEPGETLQQALMREAEEEIGCKISVGNILAVNEAYTLNDHHHAIFFTFQAKILTGNPSIRDETEISAIQWVDMQTADANMPYLRGVENLLNASAPYYFQG